MVVKFVGGWSIATCILWLFILSKIYSLVSVSGIAMEELHDTKTQNFSTMAINMTSYFPFISIWCYETWTFLYAWCALITGGILIS